MESWRDSWNHNNNLEVQSMAFTGTLSFFISQEDDLPISRIVPTPKMKILAKHALSTLPLSSWNLTIAYNSRFSPKNSSVTVLLFHSFNHTLEWKRSFIFHLRSVPMEVVRGRSFSLSFSIYIYMYPCSLSLYICVYISSICSSIETIDTCIVFHHILLQFPCPFYDNLDWEYFSLCQVFSFQ